MTTLAKSMNWWPGFNRQNLLASNIVAAWPLLAGGGKLARDVVTGADGTITDAVWQGSEVGHVLLFDEHAGSGDVILVDDRPSLNFNGLEFTWVVYLKSDSSQEAGAGIVAKGNGAGGERFVIDLPLSGGTKYRFFIRESGGAATGIATGIAPSGDWEVLIVTYSQLQGVMRVYQDGVETGSDSSIGTTLQTTTEPVAIGSRQAATGPYDLNFAGEIALVDCYDVAHGWSRGPKRSKSLAPLAESTE